MNGVERLHKEARSGTLGALPVLHQLILEEARYAGAGQCESCWKTC